ncbi:hypothetical protein CLV40_101328 [Actinokineospora auranticolor]|uniref:Uncharacterized protein n=1 Tax=Actinokineospora auranticolor TaxID=155976 RepID=A0A2S6H0X7_9PSEU|nr:hypothetical protein CLV40_101328 [Actinokineospora auranticolor]
MAGRFCGGSFGSGSGVFRRKPIDRIEGEPGGGLTRSLGL